MELYTRALVAEARVRVKEPPFTVFVGGGTPTYFPVEGLRTIFRALRELGAFEDPQVEVTVEANPESATAEKLQCLREEGANRLSLGVQSFDPAHLRAFERVHGPDAPAVALGNARRAGFRRVNVDMIFAKPGESAEAWRADLRTALSLGTEHLSCYELSFEEGTTLTRQLRSGAVSGLDDEARAAMYHDTLDTLSAAGFDAYEVSAFSKPGAECLHNLVYWTSGDWIGIGAGAGSSLGVEKFANIKNPERYAQAVLDGSGAVDPSTHERSAPRTRLAEVLMMGLRLLDGIELSVVEERTGLGLLAVHGDLVERLREQGLLVLEGPWLRATPRGRDLLDVVAASFLPDR